MGEDFDLARPAAPRTSIAALRRILETIDPREQPHAYAVLRGQLDDAIARKMAAQPAAGVHSSQPNTNDWRLPPSRS
jgi:hypothetical protein